MKFSKGFWMYKDGVTAHGCADVRDAKISEKQAVFYIAPHKVNSRLQTLAGPLLTIELSSPQKDILYISAYHYKGAKCSTPAFSVNNYEMPLDITKGEGYWEVKTGALKAVIQKEPFDMAFYYNERFLTRSGTKQLAFIETGGGPFMRERLGISVDEFIYGTGERFTPFIKNGQSIDIWNEDGGTTSELAYKNIPFVVSNRGYGVFVNNPGAVSFEIASEAVSKCQFSVPGERLDYFFIGGEAMANVVSNYTLLTGKPTMPPAWTFGLWLSTSFCTDYNEQTITSFIDGMTERGIPLSVFHFDCFWMKEYEWCNFTWDTAQFPDYIEMLSRLRQKNLKVCCWINPYIGQKSPLFDEAAAGGFLLKKTDGSIWQWDLWQPGMGIVDFTNPEAAHWYERKLTSLVNIGVDCFKTDFGERIPTEGIAWYDGSCPYKMHNYYAYLYNRIVFKLLHILKGGEAVVFARSASVGSQMFPVHWGGDCDATYESMAESLRGGLSLALAGFAFWSHDIGGFESTATADLYKRWVAFGLLSTHSRLHGSTSYRVPWLFDDEASDVLRFFTRLKHSLMPYIYTQGQFACQSGIPVMRPMVMAYPDDYLCAFLDKQYMLGDSLLVAPVFNDKGECRYYLPKGRFTNLLTNEAADGGAFFEGTFDYLSLPLFVKENSMLPRGAEETAVYDYSKNIEIHVYELKEKEITLFDNEGTPKAAVRAARRDNDILLEINGVTEGLKFVFHNLSSNDGRAKPDEGANGFAVEMQEGEREITVCVTIMV